MNGDDSTLLGRYVRDRDEAAFAELVRRHADLVWGAAFRITRDADLSQDVAQTVFVDFARKAASLPAEIILPGWLHLAACHAARKAIRSHHRRAAREARAMTAGGDPSPASDAFEELEPLLDEALTQLPPTDRHAIVLRFFSGLSFSEIGRRLGSSDDAAQKRTARALDRLREHFDRRGVLTSVDGLYVALGMAAVRKAPEGLTALLGKTAGIAGLGSTGVAAGSSLKTLLGLAVGLVAVGTAVFIPTLRGPSGPQLAAQRDDAAVSAPQPKTPGTGDLSTAAGVTEVLRLRGILARLRPDSPALAPPPGGFSTREHFNRTELMRLRGAIAAERNQATPSATNGISPPAGSIHGRLWLLGTPPPARPITAVLSDPNASRVHKTAPLSRSYLVSPEGGLANVYVHLKSGLPTNAQAIPAGRPRVELTGTFFEPYVLGVVAGQTFEIRNGDPFLYNVNASPRLNPGFNVAMANQGQISAREFPVPEPFIKLADNVHPWCIGYVCVAENQFHAFTDTNGYFTLPAGLPEGRYEIEVMHLKAGSKSSIVEYRAGEPPFLGFELTVPDGAGSP